MWLQRTHGDHIGVGHVEPDDGGRIDEQDLQIRRSVLSPGADQADDLDVVVACGGDAADAW